MLLSAPARLEFTDMAKPHISDRKKFVVAEANEENRQKLADVIAKICPECVVVQAKDGSDANFKLSNDVPHVLLVDIALPKVSGTKLLEWLFKEKPQNKVACVLLGSAEKEIFVDEAATGQVQFLENLDYSAKTSEVVQKALNFVSAQSSSALKVKQIPQNEILIRQGEKADSVYFLKKGSLVAYIQKNGKDHELGKIEAGEFVGEMAYITGEERSAFVKSLEPCEMIEIPVNILDHILFSKPSWAKALMRTLSKRVKAGNLGKLG